MDKISRDGVYELKKDDYVVVNVKNTNITLGTQFKNMFYKLTGKDTYTVGTSASGIVVNANNKKEKPSVPLTEVSQQFGQLSNLKTNIVKLTYLTDFINVKEQQLKTPTRDGYTIVEWGGTEI